MVPKVLLAVLAISTLALHCQGSHCDAACQAEQRQALQTLFSSLSGATWRNNSRWDLSDAPADNYTSPVPAHCSWYGVSCCSSTGIVAVFSQYTTPVFFNCSSPSGSVAALNFKLNKLQGPVPSGLDVWGPLASLVFLSLSGTRVVPTKLSVETCQQQSVPAHHHQADG